MSRRVLTLALGAILTFGLLHWIVYRDERLLKDGQVVLLALAPVDPQSLMQGDYMALNYELGRQAIADGPDIALDGESFTVVLKLDADRVGSFVRLSEPGDALQADEVRLRLKWDAGAVHLPTEAYFIPEGSGDRFAAARFAIFRVAKDGTALLAGLADAERRPIPDR